MVLRSVFSPEASHSTATRAALTEYVMSIASGVGLLEKETPQSYSEALKSKDAAKWQAAMLKEVDSCEKHHTWKVIDRSSLPDDANVIPVKWVYKMKTDSSGRVTEFKARLTPKGFRQVHGVDYFEVFANTGKYKTLRVALSIAARLDMELEHLDVPSAFLNADLQEKVFMEMPEGFGIKGKVYRLLKALYGLKQAPRLWYLLMSSFIKESLGFTACVSDPCLFFRMSRSGKLMLLFLFVDDVQGGFMEADRSEWNEYKLKMKERFNIKDLGRSEWMLGMRIGRDRVKKTITLDQELYVTKSLEKFGLGECKTALTPVEVGDGWQETVNDSDTDHQLYMEKVGTLLYAAISTRPDISFAVNQLTQHMQAPKRRHAVACDRVFRYLAGTKSLGLVFGTTQGGPNSSMAVSAYSDADWGHNKVDRKSITGWMAQVNGDLVSWASKKQRTVSLSTCEAELYAESSAIQETLWLRGLMSELKLLPDGPSTVMSDSQSAIAVSKNGVRSERTKHVDIKYHFITDVIDRGDVQLKWVSTKDQLADLLTKGMCTPTFVGLRDRIMEAIYV